MIAHVSIGVRDIDRSKRFYDAVLEPLGYKCLRAARSLLGYGYGRDSIAFWVVHRVSKAPSRTTTATATAGARPPTAEGVRATRMGSSAVVPRVSAADASHIGAISLSSVGLVICRIRASLFPESIPAAKTSSRRASKPRVITRSVSEAVRYPIPRYNFFSLAPDAGSNPSDHSQHLEVLAKGGPVHVKGLCQSPTGAFPEASRVRIGRREGSASATRILTEI